MSIRLISSRYERSLRGALDKTIYIAYQWLEDPIQRDSRQLPWQ